MANAFTLFGEISVDTSKLESGLTRLEKNLQEASKAISANEQEAKDLGQTNAQTARQTEKFNDVLRESKTRLDSAKTAFEQGQISAKQYANVLNSVDRRVKNVSNALKDGSARMQDFSVAASRQSESLFATITKGNLAADAIGNLVGRAGDFVKQGALMSMELDKLVRLMANLDKSFRSPIALKQLTEDFKSLSAELPFTAQQFAAASFTIKSAMGDLNRPELVEMLRKMGEAAAGSGADVAQHTANVIALAKAYNVGIKDIDQFNALIASSFGIALASDVQVAQGFNRLVTSAKSAKIPLNDIIAAMSVLQSSSNNAEENTNNLLNVISKLGSGEVIKGLKEVFNVDRFKNNGKELKSLNEIVVELAKNLDGLPEAEKLRRINEVFKDQQARIGILALIDGVKNYNAQLAQGGDMENFRQKNELMLSSIESRWTRFSNTISEKQMEVGNSFAEMFRSMDSVSASGSLTIFLFDVLDFAIGSFVGKLESLGQTIANTIIGWFSPELAEKNKQRLDEYNVGLSKQINALSDTVFNWSLTSQKASWEQVAATTADPEVRAKAEANIKLLNRAILSEVNKGITEQYDKWATLSKSIVEGLKSGQPAAVLAARSQATNLINEINARLADAKLDEGSRQAFIALGQELIQTFANQGQPLTVTINQTVNGAVESAKPEVQSSGRSLGFFLTTGLIGALLAGRKDAYDAAGKLGKSAEQGAKDAVESKSPSKVFFRIGKDVVQGFIDGINVMKGQANAAAADIIDPKILGPLLKGKGGEQMLSFLSGLVDEFNKLNAPTKADEFEQLILKIGKLSPEAKKAADAIRQFIKEFENKKGLEETKAKIEEIRKEFLEIGAQSETNLERAFRLMRDPAVTANLSDAERQLVLMAAHAKDIQAALGNISATAILKDLPIPTIDRANRPTAPIAPIDVSMFPPPPPEWVQKWQEAFQGIKDQYSDVGQRIADINAQALNDIGNVFASAVANWDGTAAGFFRSIAQGFRQMAQQIIAELIRIAIMKIVVDIGAAFGGSKTSGGKTAGRTAPQLKSFTPRTKAMGGLITGPGTAMSDSIPAMLSNGEFVIPASSVKKFGVDFFESLRKGDMPMRRYAGGGMVMPSASSVANTSNSTSNYNNVFNISVPSGAGQQQTASMVQKQVIDALRKHEKRNK